MTEREGVPEGPAAGASGAIPHDVANATRSGDGRHRGGTGPPVGPLHEGDADDEQALRFARWLDNEG